MDLIINVKDPTKRGLLAQVGGRLVASTAQLDRLVRNDGEPLTIRCAQPSDNGVQEFEEIDISIASLRVAVGLPDLVPTDGTFFLQVGPDVTADLPWNASALVVETALNLLPDIIAQGGVTVDNPSPGTYRATWNEAGTQGSIAATSLRSNIVRIYPEVLTGYVGGGNTNLDGVTTVGAAIGSYFLTAVGTPKVGAMWQLVSGTAATDLDLGIVRPLDYDPVTNAVNFILVMGNVIT